jgi:O-6-methylguanine DNA methyltransferase
VVRSDQIDTGIGPVRYWTDGDALLRVEMGETLMLRTGQETSGGRRTPLAREAGRQLREYFAGKRTAFDLPYRLDLTGFTAEILGAVARIPYGLTLSYGEVAAAIGRPRAARATGQAVGANPLPLVIPCHRVLAAHDRIGGFGCGLAVKRFLLRLEGITWTEASPG